jgi:hypothetical protein
MYPVNRACDSRLDAQLAAAAGAALRRSGAAALAPARRTALGRRPPAAEAPDLQRTGLLALRAGLRGARAVQLRVPVSAGGGETCRQAICRLQSSCL